MSQIQVVGGAIGKPLIEIKMWGGGGGGCWLYADASGGAGGYTRWLGRIPRATELIVQVGGKGLVGTNEVLAFNDGGWPGGGRASARRTAGSGAGYSGVFFGSVSQAGAVAIAGGGGGAGYHTPNDDGGAGGGFVGGDGESEEGASYRGTGGTQVAGGSGATQSGSTAEDGSALQGGNAMQFGTPSDGAGGGGGFFGGGAGFDANSAGGGSGFIRTSGLPTAWELVSAITTGGGDGQHGNTPSNTADTQYPGSNPGQGGNAASGTNGVVLISNLTNGEMVEFSYTGSNQFYTV